jgi:hypothetical protein
MKLATGTNRNRVGVIFSRAWNWQGTNLCRASRTILNKFLGTSGGALIYVKGF